MEPPYLSLSPSDSINFRNTSSATSITLSNPSCVPVAFKIRTTAPKAFAVKPTNGIIPTGHSLVVSIELPSKEFPQQKAHKFQIQATPTSASDYSEVTWAEGQIQEYKLGVLIDDSPTVPVQFESPSASSNEFEQKKLELTAQNLRLTSSLDELRKEIELAGHRLKYYMNFKKIMSDEVVPGYSAKGLLVAFGVGVLFGYILLAN